MSSENEVVIPVEKEETLEKKRLPESPVKEKGEKLENINKENKKQRLDGNQPQSENDKSKVLKSQENIPDECSGSISGDLETRDVADSIAGDLIKILVDGFKKKEGREPDEEEIGHLLEELTEERIQEMLSLP